ncbi:MAG: hypothetical protein WAZ98_10775 [Cyclobacteriaceae bacterium]
MIKYLLFSGCLFFQLAAFAQQPADSTQVPEQKVRRDTRPFMSRISLGGSTGFWINTRETFVEVSPMLAYYFPKILTTGFGYRYIYTRDRRYQKNLHTHGPNLFARAQLTRRIYLWTEWEYLKTEYAYDLGNSDITTRTDHVDSFFGGAGYIRQIGKKGRGGISVQLLYNFLYNREDHSPYYSPVIYRVGYFF